jgi:hypothetical protein
LLASGATKDQWNLRFVHLFRVPLEPGS